MNWRVLANLAGFQLGWLVCVLGGSLAGLLATLVLLSAHLRWLALPGEWRLLAGFAGLGLLVDGGLTLAGGFHFADTGWHLGPLPLWLWLLWPLFASTIRHGLAWLWHYPRLAMLGGACGGGLSYFSGARLADVALAPWLIPAEAVVWLLVCYALARRHPHEPQP